MSALPRIIEHVVLDQILDSGLILSSRSKIGLGLMAMAGFFLLIAAIFLVIATYLWLRIDYPPQLAAIMAGVMAFGLAALFALAGLIAWHSRRLRLHKMRREVSNLIHEAFEYFNAELSGPVEENPKTAAALASIAGFAAGKKVF